MTGFPGEGGTASSRPGMGTGGWTRRDFVRRTVGGSALAWTAVASGAAWAAGEASDRETGLVDVNVNLGRWPTRRLAGDASGAALVRRLRSGGVRQAWAGSFEALIHKDLGAVNGRLAEECRAVGRGRLLAFGSVNPRVAGWEIELERCAKVHRMAGVRLYPSYHGYRLEEPGFLAVLRLATELGLVVQLVVCMEDERMMNPALRVGLVDLEPLAGLVRQAPGLRLVLVNAWKGLSQPRLGALMDAGQVWVEIAMLEGVGAVETLLGSVPADRVLFGSHAPFFYFEAARLKLRESALTPTQFESIARANALRCLSRTG